MSDAITLAATARDRVGKGASRALRRQNRVPAVIYGAGVEPTGIHIEEKLLVKHLQTGHFLNTRFEIDVDGDRTMTLPRDVQFHPVTDRPIHVDFLRLGAGAEITVAVPVRFTDEEESPGLKRGGVLNIVRHEIELVCPADRIPDEIIISLRGRDVPSAIRISDAELPTGVRPSITDRDFMIASIGASSGMASEEAAASVAEPAKA
ncbi:MAG: 50S ribosomal protein L25/general stress protein Ctc [Sphingomonadaceae bacterium]|nr:50S ribosomal protein L25/general stress protein Ctc [Sphingomonadaceae bacterium]